MRINRRMLLGLGGAVALTACTPEPETSGQPQPGDDVSNGEVATREPGDLFDPFADVQVAAGGVGAVGYREFVFWDAGTGEITATVPAELGEISAVWSWNGDRIAYVADSGGVVVLDSSGAELGRFLEDDPRSRIIALSPDGLHLAAAVPDAGVKVVAIEDGSAEHLDLAGVGRGGRVHPEYLPDGRLLVGSWQTQCPPQIWSGDGSALEWDADMDEDYYFLQFGGDHFTLLGDSSIEVRNHPGFDLVEAHDTGLRPVHMDLDPAGARLAIATRQPWEDRMVLHVLDLASGQMARLEGFGQAVQSVAFSEDSSTVYGLNATEGVIAFDAATGEQTGQPFELPA